MTWLTIHHAYGLAEGCASKGKVFTEINILMAYCFMQQLFMSSFCEKGSFGKDGYVPGRATTTKTYVLDATILDEMKQLQIQQPEITVTNSHRAIT